uniref:Uncharacterized protein n=1 Tax=Arundo donax TaxID=35708 RepID=A0A0A9F2N8_ARUDO
MPIIDMQIKSSLYHRGFSVWTMALQLKISNAQSHNSLLSKYFCLQQTETIQN